MCQVRRADEAPLIANLRNLRGMRELLSERNCPQ